MPETETRCVCHYSVPCPKTVGDLLSIDVDDGVVTGEQEITKSECFFELTEEAYSE